MTRSITLAAVTAAALAVGSTPARAQAPAPAGDIVAVAVSAGSFETLVTAVKAAGLVETLQGAGPFTVFAPTDEAFAKLPEGVLAELLANPEALRAVLTYHVVPGRVMAADVLAAGAAEPATVQGETLAVRVKEGKVWVDGATVVAADVLATNGVIHVIDSVVLPKAAK